MLTMAMIMMRSSHRYWAGGDQEKICNGLAAFEGKGIISKVQGCGSRIVFECSKEDFAIAVVEFIAGEIELSQVANVLMKNLRDDTNYGSSNTFVFEVELLWMTIFIGVCVWNDVWSDGCWIGGGGGSGGGGDSGGGSSGGSIWSTVVRNGEVRMSDCIIFWDMIGAVAVVDYGF